MALTKIKTGSISDSVTLTSPDINTPDIDGGTADGLVIGGATPAAGSFTDIAASGTVDGRDVATDGTKLDGIEASADVTDTTNVTAAGALMDSELTSIASVKALNQGVATTDSPTFGGLGVGTTPASGVALDLRTNASATIGDFRNASATGYGLYVAAGDTSGQYAFRAADYQNNALFSVMGNGNVGINEATPLGKLHITASGQTTITPSAQGNLLVLEDSENGMSIISSASGAGYINFGDTADADVGMIIYDHSSNAMKFWVSAEERLKIDTIGNVGIGSSPVSWSGGMRAFELKGYSGTTKQGSIAFDSHSGANGYNVISTDTGNMMFYNGTTNRASAVETMRIASSGNVSIPTGSLTVSGSSTGLAGSFQNTHTSGYGMRVTTYSNATQYGFAVDSYGGGYSRDFTVGVDGNVNVLTGNLVIGTAGKGIDFSANANASGMTSELLDDYEEGDFTLVLSGATTAGSQSGGSSGGRYTKIGRVVTVSVVIANTTLSGAAGALKITGFPFLTANYANRPAVGVMRAYNQDLASPADGYFNPTLSIEHGVNYAVIVQTKDNGTWSLVQVENSGSLYFEGTITYITT